ncbi:cytochrome P450 [Armillaria solidipes]|uniref:Cytochrome P450 n=1 Tax=Armillaria solidipes TaxID=1076256 RepID=A0A2H3AZF5_9AGAR|nr:cytochrome P450 [Armillaria solidipes]
MSFLRLIPGPKEGSFIFGNLREVLLMKGNPSVEHEQWLQHCGPTLSLKGFFGMRLLMTIDTKALTHILFNAYDYPKPPITRTLPTEVIGQGIIIAEGNEHRRQRKVMSPAFSHSHILQFHDIFLEKATQLRQIWTSECVKSSGKAQIDTVSYLSRLTLDIMALTGFNFKTDSLNAENTPNKVHRAICELRTAKEIQTMRIFSAICPILRWIPNEGRARIQATHETLAHDLGRQLLAEAKTGDTNESSVNDLFSLLARANGSPDVPIDQRMSEADVLSQIPALLLAGHETRHVEIVDYSQHTKKLREELLATSTDTPTVDEMNALPYLDWVIRETLRVNPPVPPLARVAGKDNVIPLRQPFKSDTRGRLHDSIPIMKGELIIISIMSLWGDDAAEFRPERWEKIPETVDTIPGAWSNTLSFLGGPRSCIGYRFSIAQMKVILFVLIREFESELAVPCEEIISKSTVVQWPTLKSDPAHGPQMPIFVTVHHKEE